MERAPKSNLARFDPKGIPQQAAECEVVYNETFEWLRGCTLDLDPPMPPELRNRAADNWRVLLAIADAAGPEWSKAAREAAITLSAGQEEDLAVTLLGDIRNVFDAHPAVDRLASALIVSDLIERPDGRWAEWRGLNGNQAARKLTQSALAAVLRLFSIQPRTIWPPRRGTHDRSAKGYFRRQFEEAWASYCDETGTPAQRNNIRYLHEPSRSATRCRHSAEMT